MSVGKPGPPLFYANYLSNFLLKQSKRASVSETQMVQKKLDLDPEEFAAWLRGTPKQVAAPPPPNRPTKTFILTMMSRDVVVIPPAIWEANVRRPL
jgi:hypothetical protein